MKKLLLIGLGRWGVNHLRILSSMPVDLYACDVQPKALEIAKKTGLAEDHFGMDYRAFAGRMDAAVVLTPAESHFQLCRELLEMGKDVFVEKPICLVSPEALELANLAQRKGRILQTGHIFRYDPATQWLRQRIAEKQFGRIHLLRGSFSGFKRPRNDSGVTFADAIHFIDLMNHLLGQTPVKVQAVMKDFLGRGMEDASLISLEYDMDGSRSWGVVETNYFVPGKFRELTVVGSDMTAVCDYNVAQYKIKTFANRHVAAGKEFKAEEGPCCQIECPPEEPLRAELREFLKSLDSRQAPLADAWSGYHAVQVIEAALESASCGKEVRLHPGPNRGGRVLEP